MYSTLSHGSSEFNKSIVAQAYDSVSTSCQQSGRNSKESSNKFRPTLDEFHCKLCKRQFVDPRVLQCFHSFCLTCLRDWFDSCPAPKADSSKDSSGATEAGCDSSNESRVSGYESEVNTDIRSDRRISIQCPECGLDSKLPAGGLIGLPPHFILKQRMILASINEESVCVLCDLCSSDIPAVTRCSYCLLNLCLFCSEAHQRQRGTSDHEMVDIRNAGKVSSSRRQIMCPLHAGIELSLYCTPCEQVVCRDCCILLHRGHPCEVTSRVAKSLVSKLREKLKKSKKVKVDAEISLEKLNIIAQRVELRCSQVEGEIEKFIESYIKAVEEHTHLLKTQVSEARTAKLQVVDHHQQQLEKVLQIAGTTLKFGEELMNEGSETEALIFAGPLLRRLEECLQSTDTNYLAELKLLETLNFLPDERAGHVFNRPMFGMVTTQRVSAAHCSLAQDGLTILNNCRQQQRCEVILITRDCDGQPICHGGEHIRAEARYRDLSHRLIPVSVIDRQDGSYSISFTPDSSGNMLLSVSVRGSQTKGSPFPVCVRTLRPHHGTFHCCTFCSSGGRKDSSCGCGGQMKGGYKGCGHGHSGHPGRRHWSCCGNTLLNSECSRPPQTIQFCL